MTILRINADGTRPVIHNSPQSFASLIHHTRYKAGPVVVLTHGYSYQPNSATDCPHELILASTPSTKAKRAISWPRALGLDHEDCLCIAFGWNARGSLWSARKRAMQAGRALEQVITCLRRANPHRPVHFLSHSMGIELALEALHYLAPGSLNRVVSLTGAAYRSRVEAALTTPAGQTAEFFNVTTRENDPFDFLFERIIAPPTPRDRAVGHGLSAANAVTLQLDCPQTLASLAQLGLPLHAPDRRICHWSSYMRPGVFSLYKHLLCPEHPLALPRLQEALPAQTSARWSRLFARPRCDFPLPFVQNAP